MNARWAERYNHPKNGRELALLVGQPEAPDGPARKTINHRVCLLGTNGQTDCLPCLSCLSKLQCRSYKRNERLLIACYGAVRQGNTPPKPGLDVANMVAEYSIWERR